MPLLISFKKAGEVVVNRLVINSVTREKRFALLKSDKLERLYIEQPGHQSLVGSIFLGTVEKVLPGMNAAFVNFGEEKSGFLSRDKLPSYVLDTRSKAEKAMRAFLAISIKERNCSFRSKRMLLGQKVRD